ncbi:hypothetical protein Ami103574_14040 [Aminipila butyrica]|uniref:ABC-transporter type IV n=1 Tax=Aminipila butyrica TaxID=433296 RepID=A0A858BWN3_9FIRM|nr:hypothetical protein [Aminipila butyrica]QIB70343.1 hypothetical protein Ami103574_14040 [Aminipila butyrica]
MSNCRTNCFWQAQPVLLTSMKNYCFTDTMSMEENFARKKQNNLMEESVRDAQPLRSFIIFTIGFLGYGIIEVLFRGYTHWSMLVTGGACLLTLCYLNDTYREAPILLKALVGSLVITAYELAVGLIVNRFFHFNVWDYSNQPFDFLGQICPLFTFLWFLLCLPLLAGARFFSQKN